jgi:hypothetical protein
MINWADEPIAAVRCDLDLEKDEGVLKIHLNIEELIAAIKSHRSRYDGNLLAIYAPRFMSSSVLERGPAQAKEFT